MIKELTIYDLDAGIKGSRPVMAEFYSPSCVHCKRMEKALEELDEKWREKVYIGKCDVTVESALAAQYDITSVPTLLFFKDGQIKEKLVGTAHTLIIEETLKKL